MFDVEGRAAIVTGSAQGLGREFCRRLLAAGARGVAVSDVNEEAGRRTEDELGKEFGADRVIFVK